MILTPRLQHALDLAATLHKNHVRIGERKIPYVTHLFSVAAIVDEYGGNEDAIIAGLLHDTIEDIPEYTLEMLRNDCGSRVAEIVWKLSEPREFHVGLQTKDRWLFAKESYLKQISDADIETLLVSAGDKIHNMQSIIDGFTNNDTGVIGHFKGERFKGQLWFYGEVLSKLETKIPEELVTRYKNTFTELAYLYSTEGI